jgi:hypothetical protein
MDREIEIEAFSATNRENNMYIYSKIDKTACAEEIQNKEEGVYNNTEKPLMTQADEKLILPNVIIETPVTLNTHLSYFKNHNEKKKNKLRNKWDQFRHNLLMSVENVYFHIIVLILALYSLFHEDFTILFAPNSVDKVLHHVTEAVFFFFILEFLIVMIAKKKFIGSFYFYLDIISLISLIPEVEFIWDAIIAGISDNK